MGANKNISLDRTKRHGIEYFGDTAAFTFFCDSNWDVRTYFENWMTTIADPLSKEVSFPEEHVGQVEVFALDREDNIVTMGNYMMHFQDS